ncbi:MAG: thioredoxin family protein [Prolixibacteraceae bacterium]|nr:thioredoxin family protein [Prolixibacteraceae bacterium]
MKQLKCSEFEQQVVCNEKKVVLLFTNDWSGSAIILEGALSALQKKWSQSYRFIKISNDDCMEIGGKYNIQNIPTILIFDKGKVIDKIGGVQSKHTIENVLEKLNKMP